MNVLNYLPAVAAQLPCVITKDIAPINAPKSPYQFPISQYQYTRANIMLPSTAQNSVFTLQVGFARSETRWHLGIDSIDYPLLVHV